ncbi:hypothetical protein I4F81_007172 [Pyropia yezoensis]|uniref:Uncharacterized protein n=1 Tax=Pyropia yezoensis TaxID=2788 RepID=A0ACC3C429_PYRYE|nr:hypothetical protein I4F81_007172 [Neopyropia yezoensis]
MGLFSSGAFHYCARRLDGWLPAWRSLRPAAPLAAAAAAYVAAAPPPLVAVHVRDLEDGRDPAVLAAVDGVAAEIDAALGAARAALLHPPLPLGTLLPELDERRGCHQRGDGWAAEFDNRTDAGAGGWGDLVPELDE